MLSTTHRSRELHDKVGTKRHDADAAKGIATGCLIGVVLWTLPVWLLLK